MRQFGTLRGMIYFCRMVAVCTLLALHGGLAGASAPEAELPRAPTLEEWRMEFRPYLWALGNDLHIATEEYNKVDSTGFVEALGQYDYGMLWAFTAHKGPWGFFMDGHFVRLTGDGVELGLPFTSDIRQGLFEFAGMRRIGQGADFVEFILGVRYFRMKSDVNVKIVGGFDDLFQWVEPLAGLRLSKGLNEAVRCELAADVGGLGVGSDLTWQVTGAVEYEISPRYVLSMGYRHINIHYTDGPRRYDSVMSGPTIGLGTRF